MNIGSAKLFTFAFLAFIIPASTLGETSAIPLGSFLAKRPIIHSPYRIIVSGVLGFAPNCQLAVYSNPTSAKLRDLASGIKLDADGSKGLFPTDATVEVFFGRYVLASGKVNRVGSELHLSNPNVYHAFPGSAASRVPHCEPGPRQWATVTDVLANPLRYEGRSISIAGILGPLGEVGGAIFVDEPSARAGVRTNAIIISDRDWLERSFPENNISESFGRYVVISGIAVRGIVSGSTLIVLKSVSDYELIE